MAHELHSLRSRVERADRCLASRVSTLAKWGALRVRLKDHKSAAIWGSQ